MYQEKLQEQSKGGPKKNTFKEMKAAKSSQVVIAIPISENHMLFEYCL